MPFNPIILNVDSQAQLLVAFQSSVGGWPKLFQGDTRDIQIGVVQPTGLPQQPYSIPNLAGYTLYVTIGATPKGDGSQKIYAGPIAMAWNAALNGGAGAFSGSINLTGANLATDMGVGQSVTATVEFNLSAAGVPQGIYQDQVIIYAPENANGIVVPQPANQYLTSVQTAAEFVPRSGGAPGQGYNMISPGGNKFILVISDDGLLVPQRIA